MITGTDILFQLPDYKDEWVVLKNKQYVPDIIDEVLSAHRRYQGYYDRFSYMFADGTVSQIADSIYTFCSNNIVYAEESDKAQTTALPTGILIRGTGDCKHYAMMAGGIVDSLNRLYDADIPWCYCFAGYNGSREPFHVFVEVYDRYGPIWIDPTPGAENETPTLLIRKTP